MDKVTKTPRTNEARISAWGEGGIEGGIGFSAIPVEFCRELERELVAQKEHYRVLEEEMLVLGDERLCATLDAKENMEIANEFKHTMEEYRQRAEAAYKQSHIDAIDAERYRWLRVQNWFSSPLAVVTKPIEAIKLGYDCPSGSRLDALIDDSMREMK